MEGDGNGQLPPAVEKRILRAVDSGLDSFGKNVKEVYYSELESSHGVKISDILRDPDEFQNALAMFFMAGSPLVERSIGKEILREFDLPQYNGVNFRTAIEIVKRHPRTESFLDPASKHSLADRPPKLESSGFVKGDFEKNPDW